MLDILVDYLISIMLLSLVLIMRSHQPFRISLNTNYIKSDRARVMELLDSSMTSTEGKTVFFQISEIMMFESPVFREL